MTLEVPPEGWLVKLLGRRRRRSTSSSQVTGYEDVEEILERSEVMRVASLDVPVARVEDVPDAEAAGVRRALPRLHGRAARRAGAARADRLGRSCASRRAHSPYARGFFALLEALDVIPGEDGQRPGKPDAGTGLDPRSGVVSSTLPRARERHELRPHVPPPRLHRRGARRDAAALGLGLPARAQRGGDDRPDPRARSCRCASRASSTRSSWPTTRPTARATSPRGLGAEVHDQARPDARARPGARQGRRDVARAVGR